MPAAPGRGCRLGSAQALRARQATQNQSADYPREFVDNQAIPIIGEGVLARIAHVKRTQRGVFLADPFTSSIFRSLTDAEITEIGTHTSVLEHYGKLGERQLALTFDDGPTTQYTAPLLDILAKNKVPATFSRSV